jgi:tight adherence protein C
MSYLTYYLLDPQFVVMMLAAVAAFATVTSILLPLLWRDRLASRMRYVATERQRMQAQRLAQLNQLRGEAKLRKDPMSFMKKLVESLNLRKALETDQTRMKLKMAGFRHDSSVIAFLFARVTLPILTFLLVFTYLYFLRPEGLHPLVRVGVALAGGYLGFYLPNIFVSNIIQRRQKSIARAFPDALDLLLICVQAGMSIEAATNKVATEIGNRSLPLAEEFNVTTAELSFLQDRRRAYEDLGNRTGLAAVNALCTSLIQAERYGTALSQAMRVLAKESREMRMAEAEKKAAMLPPKLTVPMIVFFLPVLIIVILGPAIIQVMEIWG